MAIRLMVITVVKTIQNLLNSLLDISSQLYFNILLIGQKSRQFGECNNLSRFSSLRCEVKMTPRDSFKKYGHETGIGRNGEHRYGDLGQILILVGFLAVWILDSFIVRYSTFLSAYVPIYVRLILAALILVPSIYLIRSGHRAISDEVLSSPRILTDGAFSRVRHPLYLAAILFYVLLIVLTLSLISLVVFAGTAVFYNCIATYEEKILEQEFGPEYRDYRKNVPKWIPRLKL